MNKNLKYFVSFVLSISPVIAFSQDSYSSNILKKARTASLIYTKEDSSECKLNEELKSSFDNISKLINESGTLKVLSIEETKSTPPDIGIVVSIDATKANENFSPGICNFTVRISVVHSTIGLLRYDSEPKLIRIIAFQKFIYGSVPQHILNNESMKQLDEAFYIFLSELRKSRLPIS
jgi:hypothetical protein